MKQNSQLSSWDEKLGIELFIPRPYSSVRKESPQIADRPFHLWPERLNALGGRIISLKFVNAGKYILKSISA